jgi:hypothetical protein
MMKTMWEKHHRKAILTIQHVQHYSSAKLVWPDLRNAWRNTWRLVGDGDVLNDNSPKTVCVGTDESEEHMQSRGTGGGPDPRRDMRKGAPAGFGGGFGGFLHQVHGVPTVPALLDCFGPFLSASFSAIHVRRFPAPSIWLTPIIDSCLLCCSIGMSVFSWFDTFHAFSAKLGAPQNLHMHTVFWSWKVCSKLR